MKKPGERKYISVYVKRKDQTHEKWFPVWTYMNEYENSKEVSWSIYVNIMAVTSENDVQWSRGSTFIL